MTPLRKIMKARGLHFADLSKQSGVPITSLYQYAAGQCRMTAERAYLIASSLGVSIESLLGHADICSYKETDPRVHERSRQIQAMQKEIGELRHAIVRLRDRSRTDAEIADVALRDLDKWVSDNQTWEGGESNELHGGPEWTD